MEKKFFIVIESGTVGLARTAEYSIKGYLYQFLRYFDEILAANEDTMITIEGAIEDIDVAASDLTTAIQCKYHGQADKYTLGKIYKPILLMLEHFSKNMTASPKVFYRLFCYFPDMAGVHPLTNIELTTVLRTDSKSLKPIIARIAEGVDHVEFLKNLTIEFGPSTEILQQKVLGVLREKGFSDGDIDAIIFPHAIQKIVDLATKSNVADRTVDPKAFLLALHDVRKVTFTRWTRELTTRHKIFNRLRDDLKQSLAFNLRNRVFVINPDVIESFDNEIVCFIKNFVEHYSCKYLHSNPPLFMITGDYNVGALQARLYDAGLSCEDGMVGGSEFRIKKLFHTALIKKSPFRIEFCLRLAIRTVVDEEPPVRPDDIFLVNVPDDPWANSDVNVFKFDINRLSELEFVLQLRKNHV